MSDNTVKDGHGFTLNKTKALILGITSLLTAAVLILLAVSFFKLNGSLAHTIRITLVVLAALLGILLVNIWIFFSSLNVIDSKAKVISQGNLNISDIVLEKTRGLENLTLALNDMKANFLGFIELTKGNIITLSDAIDQVSKSIDMNYTGNEQIAASMSVVAEKAQQQLKLVNDMVEGLENSNTRIKKIIDSTKAIEEYIDSTVTETATGAQNLEDFINKLNTMSENLDSTNQFMQELNGEIGKISKIGEFIIQVSGQLKLLSLNASIEAARAGEAGKGFAVVSNEIRNLSNQTQESMKKIDEIVSEVLMCNETVNSSISGFVDSFRESQEFFNKVKESFQSINQKSGIINKDMKGIYQEINEIGSFTADTKEKGTQLQAASDEISSSTQDVAAVTEEVLAGLEGITSQAYSLNTMLSNIQGLVKRFNTSILPVDRNSSKSVKIACLSLINNEFWDAIQRGAVYAQKELAQKNAVVDFIGYDPNCKTPIGEWFVTKMRECIKGGYQGFSLPGFLPDTIPVVKEAVDKNIIVMAFNCDFAEKTSRMAIFGPNNYEGGKLAGNLISSAVGNSGDIVLVRGSSEVAENRKKGVLDAVKKFKKIKIVDDIAINDNADSVYETVKEYIQNNSDIQGICVAGGGVEGGAKALEELGFAGKIKLVGFEHTKEIYQYIQKGIIYASVGQDTFGQGHDPLIWLYNCIVTGEKTPSEIMYLRSDVVDSRNINDLFMV